MKQLTSRYGLPYKGSKNKIADWVVDCLPPADCFVDLFCGGCSITHAQLVRGHYKRYIANDINGELPRLFLDAAHGRLDLDYRWVSREEFDAIKDADIVTRLCYSFGMSGKNYIYGKNNEDFKHAYHQAVVDRNLEPIKRYGFDLSPILMYKTIEDRYIGAKAIIKRRDRVLDWITEENLPRLQHLEKLQHLEELESLERLESLELLESLERSYESINIPPNSTVYCDIPYVDTSGYGNEFDHRAFYEWALTRPFPVFVSEYWMPDDFTAIAMKGKYVTLSAKNNSDMKAEKIFVQKRYAAQYQRELFI